MPGRHYLYVRWPYDFLWKVERHQHTSAAPITARSLCNALGKRQLSQHLRAPPGGWAANSAGRTMYVYVCKLKRRSATPIRTDSPQHHPCATSSLRRRHSIRRDYHLARLCHPLPRPLKMRLLCRSSNLRLAYDPTSESATMLVTIWPGRYLCSLRSVVSCSWRGASTTVPICRQLAFECFKLTWKRSGALPARLPPFMKRLGSSVCDSWSAW